MSYRDGSEMGCLRVFFIGFFAIAIIVSGIRGCVNGDIKLPKLGSHKVSGGSGGLGTSNGYNVQYNNTTSPNYNSSTNDFGYTNQFPTEYRKGGNSSTSNSNNNTHSSQNISHTSSNTTYGNTVSSTQSNHNTTIGSSPSLATTQSNLKNPNIGIQSQQSIINTAQSTETRVTCSRCRGSGEEKTYYRFESYGGAFTCPYCSRTDAHGHEQWEICSLCFGKGYEVYESCSHCKGTGYDYDMYGNRQQCFYCFGKGKNKRIGL